MSLEFNYISDEQFNNLINVYDKSFSYKNKEDFIEILRYFKSHQKFRDLFKNVLYIEQSLTILTDAKIILCDTTYGIVSYRLSMYCSVFGSFLKLEMSCSKGNYLLYDFIKNCFKKLNYSVWINSNNNLIEISIPYTKLNLEYVLSTIASIQLTLDTGQNCYKTINLS